MQISDQLIGLYVHTGDINRFHLVDGRWVSECLYQKCLDSTFLIWFPFRLVLNIVCASLLVKIVLNVISIPLHFSKTEFDWLNGLNKFLCTIFNFSKNNLNIACFVVSTPRLELLISRIPCPKQGLWCRIEIVWCDKRHMLEYGYIWCRDDEQSWMSRGICRAQRDGARVSTI